MRHAVLAVRLNKRLHTATEERAIGQQAHTSAWPSTHAMAARNSSTDGRPDMSGG
jgi:hypothetical protein